MSTLPVPEKVRATLEHLPGWFPGAVGWAVGLANHGPRWVPRKLRHAPLWCAGVAVRLVVQRLNEAAKGAPGYGVQPHGSEAQLTPLWQGWHLKANPAGLAPDGGQAVSTQPSNPKRHEKPDPEPSGSAGTHGPESGGSVGTHGPSKSKKFNLV